MIGHKIGTGSIQNKSSESGKIGKKTQADLDLNESPFP